MKTTFLLTMLWFFVLATPAFSEKNSLEELQKTVVEQQELIEELEERLDDVEKQNASDTIHWRGELRVISHNTTYRQPDQEIKEKNDFRQLRLRLHMRTDVVNKFRFVGRLSTFKNWGESFEPTLSLNTAVTPNDSSVYLERAYVDYFFNSIFSFSFGRIPASDGPPSELIEESPRQSTYPQALYEIELDGIVLSANLPGHSFMKPAARFIYGEFNNSDESVMYRDNGLDSIKLQVYQLESELSFARTQGLIVLDHAEVTGLGSYTTTIEELRQNLSLQTGVPYKVAKSPKSVWDGTLNLIHIQFNDIENTGIDFYSSYIHTAIDSNGKRYQLSPVDPTAPLPSICFGASTNCFADTKPERQHGYAVNTGITYRLPLPKLSNPKIGAEYHTASKDTFSPGFVSEYADLGLVFHNVLGHASHVYWIQPLKRNLFARFGIRRSKSNYLNFFDRVSAASSRLKQSLEDAYFLLNARF